MDKSEKVAQFTAFYEATRTPVYRAVLLARVGEPHSAEDAVAEAYEKAFLRWDKPADHPNPAAWVIRTAINGRISLWRRHRKQTSEVLGDSSLGNEGLDPALVALILELPRGQREVLALRVLLDFSTEQTAEVLGVKQGTVKKQLHRALHALRGHLAIPEAEEVPR